MSEPNPYDKIQDDNLEELNTKIESIVVNLQSLNDNAFIHWTSHISKLRIFGIMSSIVVFLISSDFASNLAKTALQYYFNVRINPEQQVLTTSQQEQNNLIIKYQNEVIRLQNQVLELQKEQLPK